MAGIDFLGPLFEAVTAGLHLISEQKAKEWSDAVTQNELAIQAEEQKGDQADDAKIVALYSKRPILAAAARDELLRAVAAAAAAK